MQGNFTKKKPLPPEECHNERENQARNRNFFIFRPVDSDGTVMINCLACNSTNPINWYFIPRNNDPLVDYHFSYVYQSEIVLIQSGNLVVNSKLYCISPSFDLVIHKFEPSQVLGTYYCHSSGLDILKYIWYHVDTIYPSNVNGMSQIASKQEARSTSGIRDALAQIEIDLKQKIPAIVYEYAFWKIVYKFDEKPYYKKLCGDFILRYYRKCYVEIPVKSSNEMILSILSKEETAHYFVMRDSFVQLLAFKTMDPKSHGRAYDAAKIKAINMAESFGFILDEISSNFVVPCHLSLFRHFSKIKRMGNAFELVDYFGEIHNKIRCPSIDPLDIIKLAMTRDMNKLRMRVLENTQQSMRSVDRLYIEDMLNERLTCGFSEQFQDICNTSYATVQWRKADLVFGPMTVVKERVYVNGDCQLLFTIVTTKDKGIYYCYRRTLNGYGWNIAPTTKFLIQVQSSGDKLPPFLEVLKYFMVLVLWTVIVVVLWFLLTVTNIRMKINARYRADERRRLLDMRQQRKIQNQLKKPAFSSRIFASTQQHQLSSTQQLPLEDNAAKDTIKITKKSSVQLQEDVGQRVSPRNTTV